MSTKRVPLDPCKENDGLHLGGIFCNVEFLEWIKESDDHSTISSSTLVFPLVMVMGQECDLLSDSALRAKTLPEGRKRPKKPNGFMWTTLVLPLYNAGQFFSPDGGSTDVGGTDVGGCLYDIRESVYVGDATEPDLVPLEMSPAGNNDLVRKNGDARYQFICFPESTGLPDCVIDFRHYFAVQTSYLLSRRKDQCLGTLTTLYREHVLQRFTSYLSRIGLPD